MNNTLIVLLIGIILFTFQVIFFFGCIKWLSNSKRKRDKDFAILDAERAHLIDLKNQLKSDIDEAKKLADETLKKLKVIGTEAHAEWDDVTRKINDMLLLVDTQSEKILENNISKLHAQKLSVDKSLMTAKNLQENLTEKIAKGEKLLKLFDSNLPTNEVLKELQTVKYSDAKNLLAQGIEASVIAKNLGLSIGEVIALSTFF